MLYWAAVFLIIALAAGLIGFGGIATVSFEFAKIIFVVALVLFIISTVLGLLRRGAR
jgi:uncharacterized membrane protein YtjA (UPF0391 family)